MHELSIAQSIFSIVQQAVPADQLGQVKTIYLKIGTLSGIEVDALIFSFDILKEKSPFPSATLSVEMIESRARCNDCGNVFSYEGFGTECPQCGSFSLTIVQGREMKVTGIDVD